MTVAVVVNPFPFNALVLEYAGADVVVASGVLENLEPEDAVGFIHRVRKQAPAATLVLVVTVIDRCNDQTVSLDLLQEIVVLRESVWRTRDLLAILQRAGYSKVTENLECPYVSERVPWQVCLYAKA